MKRPSSFHSLCSQSFGRIFKSRVFRSPGLRVYLFASIFAMLASSCVHEFPQINDRVTVRLHISHLLDWTEYDYNINSKTRVGEPADAPSPWHAYYRIHVFPKGKIDTPAYVFELNRDDIELNDFTADITLPEGEWDIYCWQDFRNPNEEPFYIADRFPEITYQKPYRGDTQWRDAFEGRCHVSVPATMEISPVVEAEMEMERPLAKYVFIATDFEKFYTETLTRFQKPADLPRWEALSTPQKEQALQGYSVPTRYPLYMPAVYNLFTQRVMESWTGVEYDSHIVPLNDNEAIVATDFVFMNHVLSGAQVQLSLRTPDGQVIPLTNVINVPLQRGQITYVRGDFLTTTGSGGINIEFSFSGDINIKL